MATTMPQRANKNVVPKTIEQLKAIPCRKGHSRHDAYVYFNPFNGHRNIVCKTCAIQYYHANKDT